MGRAPTRSRTRRIAVGLLAGAAIVVIVGGYLGRRLDRRTSPSVHELNWRLQVVGGDASLDVPAPGAVLQEKQAVLCADPSPPVYVWRYRYDGQFDSVAAFYRRALNGGDWTAAPTPAGGLALHRRYDGWTADGVVSGSAAEYSVSVAVDRGYESGCAG